MTHQNHPSKQQALLNLDAAQLQLRGGNVARVFGKTYWQAVIDGVVWVERDTLDVARECVEESLYNNHFEDWHDGDRTHECEVEFVEINLDTGEEVRRVKEAMSVDLTPHRSDFAEHNTLNRAQQGV